MYVHDHPADYFYVAYSAFGQRDAMGQIVPSTSVRAGHVHADSLGITIMMFRLSN